MTIINDIIQRILAFRVSLNQQAIVVERIWQKTFAASTQFAGGMSTT